ncbi:hypothetical protein H5410_050727 [Solanum commersonii]|uniref:Uncharacterized protein n=1 Tax=Solanum commersonii TaxID=4109 RepID=A0A9J5WYF9_SOLCO|nr:hypothetical protein H5410_050727 [Solanum commersonii]
MGLLMGFFGIECSWNWAWVNWYLIWNGLADKVVIGSDVVERSFLPALHFTIVDFLIGFVATLDKGYPLRKGSKLRTIGVFIVGFWILDVANKMLQVVIGLSFKSYLIVKEFSIVLA